ncbi:hypothetical protein GGX14DRAFT_580503 [Mycena pura]|uniref:Uncharacterized protein n=1 Tax=Mycena pura TaxID=153505 RepID=A0AAD6UMI5_9AGAR|nr:hypothetical protein GGX14DRAFT_580503 [Mycena pura]
MPAATHISTPFAPPEAAPPPRVILLAHTDLDSYAPVALLMHENLALARPRNAETIAPAHTYPPAPTEKIASPSKLSRILLENAPEWKEGTQLASEIKNTVRELAAQHLDLRYAHSRQEDKQLEIIYREAAKSHPQLDKYANNWPVRCVLMAHLKITSREATKRKDILKKVKKEERAVKKEVRARIKNRDRGKGRGGGKPVQRRRDRRDESDDSESSSSSSLTSLTSGSRSWLGPPPRWALCAVGGWFRPQAPPDALRRRRPAPCDLSSSLVVVGDRHATRQAMSFVNASFLVCHYDPYVRPSFVAYVRPSFVARASNTAPSHQFLPSLNLAFTKSLSQPPSPNLVLVPMKYGANYMESAMDSVSASYGSYDSRSSKNSSKNHHFCRTCGVCPTCGVASGGRASPAATPRAPKPQASPAATPRALKPQRSMPGDLQPSTEPLKAGMLLPNVPFHVFVLLFLIEAQLAGGWRHLILPYALCLVVCCL